MRAVIQRVNSCSVTVDGEVVGKIERGVLALVGFAAADNDTAMEYILNKIIGLRIFEDSDDKMNLSVEDIGGGLMIVPNFTVYGDARKGKRPSYFSGAEPKVAQGIYERFVKKAQEMFKGTVQTGVFQAEMKVALENDGPVTILLDSDKLF